MRELKSIDKDKLRDQLAEDIKNYLGRGKVIRKCHHTETGIVEPDAKKRRQNENSK